jgi:hypothetical protein
MKMNVLRILVMAAVVALIAFMTIPSLNQLNLPTAHMSPMGSEMVEANVQQIIEDGNVDLGGTIQRYQVARVELLEGDYKGIVMEMD